MVTQKTTGEIFRKLREDEENCNCFECSTLNITHVSVNLGIMLCTPCANKHLTFGSHISFIRSLKDPWNTHYLRLMTAGGNSSLKAFFSIYTISLSDESKYKTVACEYYREMLEVIAGSSQIRMITPSIEEGRLLMEEFCERDVLAVDKKEVEKVGVKHSGSLTSFKEFTSDALDLISKGVKWGTEIGKEGLEWGAKQGKRIIKKLSFREEYNEQAKEMYTKIQANLNVEGIREETLQLISELECVSKH